jgi:hypothetical protein
MSVLITSLYMLVALSARAGDLKPPKQAYLVCEGRCLQGVSLGPKAQVITPMIDGKPDRSKAVLKGAIVNYDSNLEKVELR